MRGRLVAVAVVSAAALSPACGGHAEQARSATASATAAPPTPPAAEPRPTPFVAPADGPWRAAGASVQGRPIRTLRIGDGPRRVLFIGGIHGDEDEGSHTTAQLPAAFTAARLGDRVTLTIIEDANPDGRAAHTRVNANGVDVNRNFPAPNFDPADPSGGGTPLSQPESRAVHNLIAETRPDLIVVMHSWQGREFVNFDGPAQDVAERFSAASGLPVTASNEFAPTPGSLGSYAGRDRKIPVLSIELLKGSDPEKNWENIRDALLAVIGG